MLMPMVESSTPRMDLLSCDGETFDRETRRTSESRLSQTIIALDAMDINVKSHSRCVKSTAGRFFTNNIVVRDRKKSSVIVRYTESYAQLANTSILGTRFAQTN